MTPEKLPSKNTRTRILLKNEKKKRLNVKPEIP